MILPWTFTYGAFLHKKHIGSWLSITYPELQCFGFTGHLGHIADRLADGAFMPHLQFYHEVSYSRNTVDDEIALS